MWTERIGIIGAGAVGGALTQGRRFEPGTPGYLSPYLRYREPLDPDPYHRYLEAEAVPVPVPALRDLLTEAAA